MQESECRRRHRPAAAARAAATAAAARAAATAAARAAAATRRTGDVERACTEIEIAGRIQRRRAQDQIRLAVDVARHVHAQLVERLVRSEHTRCRIEDRRPVRELRDRDQAHLTVVRTTWNVAVPTVPLIVVDSRNAHKPSRSSLRGRAGARPRRTTRRNCDTNHPQDSHAIPVLFEPTELPDSSL